MKVLKKSTCQKVYRFKCYYCKSTLEMTENERREEDLKYDEYNVKAMSLEERRNDPHYRPHNPMGYFDCPVCNKRSFAQRHDWHRFTIMEDGSEVMDY